MSRRRKGTGSVERDVDASGRERFRARLFLTNGERKPVGTYDTEVEANVALAAAIDDVTEGQMARIAGVTLKHFGPRFLNKREADGVRGIKTERSRWKIMVDGSPLADTPMSVVTRRDAKAWVAWLLTRKIQYSHAHSRNGQKVSRTTAQNAINLVSKAFDEAVDDEIIPANPFAGVKLPKFKGRTHEPWTFLTAEEQTALLAVVPEPDRFLVAFAIGTGLRQGEQWSLRWEDVDIEGGEIVVRYGSEGNATKSGRIRRVPILGLTLDALGAYLAGMTQARREKLADSRLLVWPGPRGDRRQKGEPEDWKAWVTAAGIARNVRWHDLRHTCASSLVAGWWGRRWSLYEVKEILGHASITTTERYAHLADSALKLAAREMANTPAISPLKQVLQLPETTAKVPE